MTLLYLSSDQMGEGPDNELGGFLLKTFLEKLADSGAKIDVVTAVNGGAFLTCEGSPVLEPLKRLQARGARIRTCRTSLIRYALEEKLAVGEVGTPEQEVEAVIAADKIIRP